jgi:SAM-dependent methyltransferase
MTYSQHPLELTPFVISHIPKRFDVLIDIGCGYGLLGYILKVSSLLSRSSIRLIGIDINKEYLHYLISCKNIYDDLILASASNLPLRTKCADVSIAIEVIEHLNKSSGLNMLQELNRITRNRIILTTPNNFHQVFKAVNIYEVHHSGWTVNELRRFGFKIRGFGIKLWWKNPNSKLIYFMHYILTPLSLFLPKLAAFLIAYKDQSKENVS